MMSGSKPIPYSEYLGSEAPFMDQLGITIYVAADNECRMVLNLRHHHMNAALNTHGGVILTLLDVAMAASSRLRDPMRRNCVTLEMKTSFLRPAGSEGEAIEARGIVRHITKSMAFCDGELRNEKGELLATASGTFKFLNQSIKASDG
jgi:acyl-CoA thioesterase